MVKKEIESTTKKIVEFLKERYNPEVIILVGSRAVGDYKVNSDWDIYIFTKKRMKKENPDQFYNSLPEELKKEDLDIYRNDLDINSFSDKLWRDLRNSEVILDNKNKLGHKLREKSIKLYKKGPTKWTKEFALGRKYKAQRYIKKFEDNYKDKNYAELFNRICWHFVENIIEWWFGIRQEFPLRPQDKFTYIKKKDPKFYAQIKIIVSDKTSYKDKIEAFRKIHNLLFNSKEYKRLIR